MPSHYDYEHPRRAYERREEARREFLKNDKRPTYEVISDGVRRSRGIAATLENLASAFVVTGNDRVAENLSTLADEVLHLVEEIKAAHNRETNHHFGESQRMLGLTLAAAVAVSTREHDAAVRIAELESEVGASS